MKRSAWVLTLAIVALASGASGCNACRSTPQTDGAASAATGSETYTPPPENTTSLIESVRGRRDATTGQVTIDGRLLLPAGARIWVDLYPAGTGQSADPLARAEQYRGPRGSFAAGPFKVPPDSQFRVLITSYFTSSWQPKDVIAQVGLGGMKLPKHTLRLDRPNAPGMGAHLEQSADVTIGQ